MHDARWPLAQVPWFQVGTPFLVSTEVSASVADDIVEFQHYRRTRAARSPPANSEAEPQLSGPRTFLRRCRAPPIAHYKSSLPVRDTRSSDFDTGRCAHQARFCLAVTKQACEAEAPL